MANINSRYSKKAKIIDIIKNAIFFVLAIVLLILFIPGIKRVTGSLSIIIPYLRFIVYFVLAVMVISLISAFGKRVKFLRRLKKMCAEKKAVITDIDKPYLSVFFKTKKPTFTLKVNGKKYSCKLLSFSNKLRPVIFKEEGFYYHISAKKLKTGLTPAFISEKHFDFESDSQKILILTSIPYVVLVNNKNNMKTVDAGEVCGEYKIFNPDGFFGAVDRDTVDRKSYD